MTPPDVFFGRRRFLEALGLGAIASFASRCDFLHDTGAALLAPPFERPDVFPARKNERFRLPDALDRHGLTPRSEAAVHNNFYEFLPGRGGPVWKHAGAFVPEPWTLEVTGACDRPTTFDLDDLFAIRHEERNYHFRCVERWGMNVPWSGFPLATLLERVAPKRDARYVRFLSAYRPEEMPGTVEADYLPWPYHEGLRMDEAMHPLAFVATGVYGAPLLKQHGSPVRIVVPWKYGYKSPKSVVRIELVEEQPDTFWQLQAHEYGFLSNVNPNIPHPRWSQETSYWLDTGESFPTPIFNGYEEQVAALYPDEPRTPQLPLVTGKRAR